MEIADGCITIRNLMRGLDKFQRRFKVTQGRECTQPLDKERNKITVVYIVQVS